MDNSPGNGASWNYGSPEFPLATPSSDHAVLYHIPRRGLSVEDGPPEPQSGQDKWDHDHVRLPCSRKSEYPVENPKRGEPQIAERWQMIREAFKDPQAITNSKQLADAILSYNHTFRSKWKFTALHALFNDHLDEDESEHFFRVTLRSIIKMALDLPHLIQSPIPLLNQQLVQLDTLDIVPFLLQSPYRQTQTRSVSLSQQQIACLLANAFLCTYPRRNSTAKGSEYETYPNINFTQLYESQPYSDVLEKIKCFCHYFRRVCSTNHKPKGVVTFSRRFKDPRECPVWAQSTVPVASVPVRVVHEGTIERAEGLIQLDFANKYLGGGVLGHGSVQEEIRFATCPELMVSMLFTEVLGPTEALMMIGAERYSEYIGYSRMFQWNGNFNEHADYDSSCRRRIAVLAIDAMPFRNKAQEYRTNNIVRELNKAWVGFSFYTDDAADECLQLPGVATGNWGCGAFGGSPQLKSLIQLMACAQARRPMVYHTFDDTELGEQILNIYEALKKYRITVGQLYELLVKFGETGGDRSGLHAYLHRQLKDHHHDHTDTPADFNQLQLRDCHGDNGRDDRARDWDRSRSRSSDRGQRWESNTGRGGRSML